MSWNNGVRTVWHRNVKMLVPKKAVSQMIMSCSRHIAPEIYKQDKSALMNQSAQRKTVYLKFLNMLLRLTSNLYNCNSAKAEQTGSASLRNSRKAGTLEHRNQINKKRESMLQRCRNMKRGQQQELEKEIKDERWEFKKYRKVDKKRMKRTAKGRIRAGGRGTAPIIGKNRALGLE